MAAKKRAGRKEKASEPYRNASLDNDGLSVTPLSPDDEGLSRTASADSESVAELLDEGNAFEAGIVSGVERADDSDDEVRTHEVPENDVPPEYLDSER